jgi:hypothetical protein
MDGNIWSAIGAIIAGMAMAGGFMAFVFRLMLRAELSSFMVKIAEMKYLTESDMERHERQCPARCKEYSKNKD